MSNKKSYWILMADVVGSSKQAGKQLAQQLQQLTNYLNETYKAAILSPLTVTLGDEFQGVVKNRQQGVAILLAAEEWLIAKESAVKLRYVLWNGPIETAVNPTIAHGMLGDGLTQARQKLIELKHDRNTRFYVGNEQPDAVLNQLLFLYDSIVSQWKKQDYALVDALLRTGDYKLAAQQLGKDYSLIWRREKSLQIPQLKAIENLIQHETA